MICWAGFAFTIGKAVVVGFSFSGESIPASPAGSDLYTLRFPKSSEGDTFCLFSSIDAPDSAFSGDLGIALKEVFQPNNCVNLVPQCFTLGTGDANLDKIVNVLDLVAIADFIASETPVSISYVCLSFLFCWFVGWLFICLFVGWLPGYLVGCLCW